MNEAAVAAMAIDDELSGDVFVSVPGFASDWFDGVVTKVADDLIQLVVTFDWMAIAGGGTTYAEAYGNLVREAAEAFRDGDFDVAPRQMTEAEKLASAYGADDLPDLPDFEDRGDFTLDPSDINPASAFLGGETDFLLVG